MSDLNAVKHPREFLRDRGSTLSRLARFQDAGRPTEMHLSMILKDESRFQRLLSFANPEPPPNCSYRLAIVVGINADHKRKPGQEARVLPAGASIDQNQRSWALG